MTTLSGLPLELLLSISDYLPLVDLICLSFCNRRLHEVTTRRQTNRLSSLTQEDKLMVLTRLEKDLPEYFACAVCNLLHRYDGSESFGLSGLPHEQTSQLPCVQIDESDKRFGYRPDKWFGAWRTLWTHPLFNYTLYRLFFLQVKLAMRRFYYGPRSGISTDALSYTQVHQRPDKTSLFSTEAQICPKPLGLYIRMQDIVLVRTRDELLDLPKIWMSRSFLICFHYRLDEMITPIVESAHHPEASFANTCDECGLSFQIEIGEFDSKIALIMTRWVNLGPGLTQEDLMWRTPVYSFMGGSRRRFDRDALEALPHIPTTRSPRLYFEDIAPQPLQNLRSRNLSYLKDQQYTIVMPFLAVGNFWHISYKEPSIIGFLWSLVRR